ncbi:MAG: SDR family NAD(P)-dependent oxidoreductase [Proteobacteria bacterium]|nr:SDR family NAD(P)-dependent oxidoreductase [Pseudomonadota bacterium]
MPLKKGRRVWLVGASTGIGAALAALLLERGARVALSSRSRDALDALAAEQANALVLPADVTDAGALAAAHAQILAAWGGVDLAVFNAGTHSPVRAWELDLAQAKTLIDTNLMGVLNGLAAALPDMLAQKSGAVAVVASVAGYSGLPTSLIYGATKAALINLAETLYLDLAPKGLGVHLICPGFVETPLTAKNQFAMPALIPAAEAAREIVAGLARGEFEIHFPKRFTRVVKFLRLLPYRWYFWLVHKGTGL